MLDPWMLRVFILPCAVGLTAPFCRLPPGGGCLAEPPRPCRQPQTAPRRSFQLEQEVLAAAAEVEQLAERDARVRTLLRPSGIGAASSSSDGGGGAMELDLGAPLPVPSELSSYGVTSRGDTSQRTCSTLLCMEPIRANAPCRHCAAHCPSLPNPCVPPFAEKATKHRPIEGQGGPRMQLASGMASGQGPAKVPRIEGPAASGGS